MSIEGNQTTHESITNESSPKIEQMSNQKYKRTNFEEEENSGVDITLRPEMPSPASNFDPSITFQSYKITFWRKRTLLEKILITFFFLLLFLVILLSIILATKNRIYHTHEDDVTENISGLCLKKACINAASSILNAVDSSVNPCQDFYHYSCGNWIKSNTIPHGSRSWDTFQEVGVENLHVLKEVVESPIDESKKESTEWKIKKFYWACMDLDGHKEELDIKPILPYISIMQGWTISSIGGIKFNESAPWDFQDLLQRLSSFYESKFFNLGISENDRKPSTNMIKISQYTFLEKDIFGNKTEPNIKKQNIYKKLLFDMAMLLGGSENYTWQCVEEVYEFTAELIEMSESPEEIKESYNKLVVRNISQIQQDYPFINWLEFINESFKFTNISINSSEPVHIESPTYLSKLSPFINRTVATAKGRRSIQNFVVWSFVIGSSSVLSNRFKEVYNRYIKSMMGIFGEQDDWKVCLNQIENWIGFGLGAMFVRERFKPESKISATEMIKKIKEAFISNLASLTWMDDTTRHAAINKANVMEHQIGYPDYILNDTLLDAYFQDYDVRENEHYDNINRIVFVISRHMFTKLRSLNDKLHWSMVPSMVNAYYSPTKNQMAFPAGILQGRFFHKDLPDSINYGSIGVVVGHELTHGFDDQGSNYDSDGVFRKWWDDKIKEAFRNRTQCLIDQYSNYQMYGKHLNGKFTLGENIADNGGLKSSYKAYLNLNKDEDTLPGVHFNHKQLFFVSFAQGWCSRHTREDVERNLMSDVHSISQFRVIGSVSNFPEFSKVFNCPLGSAMNPEKKCEVW